MDNKRFVTHKVTEIECPVCGETLDIARNAQEGVYHPPVKGDASICANCTSVLIFDNETDCRIITQKEWDNLKENDPIFFKIINSAIGQIRENHERNPNLYNS